MIAKLRYLFVMALVSVLLLEIGVRVLGLAPPLSEQYGHFVADPVLPYRTAPLRAFVAEAKSGEFAYDVRHNSFGFRDVDHEPRKPPGMFRILGLGDSFTYGVGAKFEETYLHRLETLLNDRGEPPVEIVKAGIPRYFPEPERLLLEHYGLQLEPDLILVAFVTNDLTDTFIGVDAIRVDDSGYLRSLEDAGLGKSAAVLYVRSHLARTVLDAYATRQAQKKNHIEWPEFFRADGPYESTWKKIESEYARMAELARANGANIAFIHIPLGPAHSTDLTSEQVEYPARRLAAWCESVGVEFIDTRRALWQSTEEDLYWALDGHCTPAGYAVIARTLHDELLQRGLIPTGL